MCSAVFSMHLCLCKKSYYINCVYFFLNTLHITSHTMRIDFNTHFVNDIYKSVFDCGGFLTSDLDDVQRN